ncbi:hypothetical protein CPC08DRAFT_728609, partial [Agrocybe pediades]
MNSSANVTDQSLLPPLSLQKAYISVNLNSTLLIQYLAGCYIGLYALTIVLHRASRSSQTNSNKNFVHTCLFLLFVSVMVELALNWKYTSVLFTSILAETRLETVFLIVGSSFAPKDNVVMAIFGSLGQVLADGIM